MRTGERADGWILAWGIAFEDHAALVTVDGGGGGRFQSAESAWRAFSHRRKVRLVWGRLTQPPSEIDPVPATWALVTRWAC